MDTHAGLDFLPEVVGTAGGLLIVGAYFLLQTERIDPRGLSYSVVNAVGAGLILFSLVFDFNLGAALVEGFWLAVSVFGVFAWWRRQLRLAARPREDAGSVQGDA